LPEEKTKYGQSPFTDIALDLLGPTVVKAMTNKRAKLKVWPLLIVCQATSVVHIEVMHDYGSAAFMLQWRHYTAVRGRPGLVISDKGSQLTSATNAVAHSATEDPANWDWTRIAEAGADAGTRWKFVPAGCQYRNGKAERAIQVIKKTLRHLLRMTLLGDAPTLNYSELQVILTEAANIANDRPIGVKTLTEEDLLPLTVNHLLLGRNSLHTISYDESGELRNMDEMAEYHAQLLKSWWTKWREQGFNAVFGFNTRAQTKEHDDLQKGDVCLLKYKTKVSSHYPLVIVIKAEPSEDGRVRTVTVGLRNGREKLRLQGAKWKGNLPLVEMEVGVQRLVLIESAKEAGREQDRDALW
jgi:hypothetical protein